jgi:dCMP deaminase
MTIERQRQIDESYVKVTEIISQLSRAQRTKVGAVIVSNGIIISTGFNGTPRGTDNCCETPAKTEEKRVYDPRHECSVAKNATQLVTKDEVIHAELNAILNLTIAGSGASLRGSTMYVSFSPCLKCAALIKQVGITRVVYANEYRCTEGKDFLLSNGVVVDCVNVE